jgi:4-amino-4-deoxy-L-arabinose transferase-like glycosyltransferase
MSVRFRAIAVLLGFLAVSRLVAMATLPLIDTTEPRYAETARMMMEAGDWITPYFDYNVPFWGKPPLSFWTQALAFKALGVSEFAGRLPSLLVSIGIVWLICCAARPIAGRAGALMACIIYGTTALGYAMAGAVLTDPFLTFGTTLSLAALLRVLQGDGGRHWGYLFFLGMAVGLLAKGPLALVLVLVPTAASLPFDRRGRQSLTRLPWLGGTLLMLGLSLPWYLLAEYKTPGFWDYFIFGEHFKRYVDPGWKGDLYGAAHQRMAGTIWWQWLQASFPWGAAAIVMLGAAIRRHGVGKLSQYLAGPDKRLLLCWSLWPLVFFTASGNVLWTYVQPALPAFAILFAASVWREDVPWPSWTTVAAALVPAVMLIGALVLPAQRQLLNTEKDLIAYAQRHAGASCERVVYVGDRPFSARFYSAGTARLVELEALPGILRGTPREARYVAVPRGMAMQVAPFLGSEKPLFENRRYVLFHVPGAPGNTELGKVSGQGEGKDHCG